MEEILAFFSFITKNTCNKARQKQIISNNATIVICIDDKKSYKLSKRLKLRLSPNNMMS